MLLYQTAAPGMQGVATPAPGYALSDKLCTCTPLSSHHFVIIATYTLYQKASCPACPIALLSHTPGSMPVLAL
jgi:hypothetical protein